MLKRYISKLSEMQNLTLQETSDIIDFISEGKVLPSQIASFLTALKMKGETPQEITGLALKMREKALKINLKNFTTIVDSCGTGGDHSNTFNISTASAILASSCGLNVAKHANIGFTSKCGSSNVIEALGIVPSQNPDEVVKNLKSFNIAFLHAPCFQKTSTYVNPVRKEIGIRTIFNYLGPLTNPARPTGHILGISNPQLAPKIAETLNNLGTKKAMVVTGHNPLIDEISISGKTVVYRLENKKIDCLEIYPEDFGLKSAPLSEIAGGEPDSNAKTIEDIFSGKIDDAKLDIVIFNTAAILWAGEKVGSLELGVKLASELVKSGKGINKLVQLRGTK